MNINNIEEAIKKVIQTNFVCAESADNIHFYVTVVSEEFAGVSKIKQHRMVMDVFVDEINSAEIHALSIKTFTPEKWAELT